MSGNKIVQHILQDRGGRTAQPVRLQQVLRVIFVLYYGTDLFGFLWILVVHICASKYINSSPKFQAAIFC